MRIKLEFGRNGLWIDVPDRNLAAVLDRPDRPAAPDPAAAVEQAIGSPIGCEPLEQLARGSRSACVVISDCTRPVDHAAILPPIIRGLERAGVRDVKILIGNGLHRPMRNDEIQRSVGPEIAAAYPIHNHFGRDERANVCVGRTSRGTPVCLDRHYVEADFRVITSLVEPHMYAGFSGGRKAIAIGIASLETIRVIHSPLFLEHEGLRAGSLASNIFHHEACEIARMAPAQFAVNVTNNHARKLVGAYAGDMLRSHEAAIEAVRADSVQYLDGPVDIAITTNAGYPADLNLYQSPKGMQSGSNIVKQGGAVIFAAELSEGLGGREFSNFILQCPSPEEAMRRMLSPGFFVIDQWGLESICKALRKAQFMLYTTGLAPDVVSRCFLTPIASVEEGIRTALQRLGPDATIAVVPKGPYIIGTFRGAGGHGKEGVPGLQA